MSVENLEVVRAIYDAFGSGDVAGVLARFHPDIVWREAENFPYADRNPYVGPQAVAEGVFMRCATEWEGFSVEIEELLDRPSAEPSTGSRLAAERRTGHQFPAICGHTTGRAMHRRGLRLTSPHVENRAPPA
jgi:ketosteroid isomerase-like protein